MTIEDDAQETANAAHIAASDPSAVLSILDENARLEREVAALREAAQAAVTRLDKAADQFAFYADEHAKKRTPEGDAKGMTNHQWALACAKAAGPLRLALLAQSEPKEEGRSDG